MNQRSLLHNDFGNTRPIVLLTLFILWAFGCLQILLVANGLYNPFFRVRFWLDTKTWQDDNRVAFDAVFPACDRYSLDLDHGTLHPGGDCGPSSRNPASDLCTVNLCESLGNIKVLLASPDETKIALVVERTGKPIAVQTENLYVIDTSKGKAIQRVQPVDLIRHHKIQFFTISMSVGILEKIMLMMGGVLIVLGSWQAFKMKPKTKDFIWMLAAIFSFLGICYGIGVLVYGMRWLNS